LNKIRIDKWLWAVRIFKTRSKSREACLKGKIKINGKSVKPSFNIEVKMNIEVKKRFITYSYDVIGLTDKRVGAKLIDNFILDKTPEEELIKNKINYSLPTFRTKTMKGRPTKKERRDMEKIKSKFGDF
tara:strand:- start:116 stop:502 length:387 start_codon:yes stop_codon:yes gene_type:complete